ncbi:MAG: hypothetical protein H6732_13980 [Alphaproteobacteria bacterium]|nr:hypothetical protein [Alphaproteobacteria bacterium]
MNWNDPRDREIATRHIDAAIAAMARNRALILTLNLVAGLVAVNIYVGSVSLDAKQRANYLMSISSIHRRIENIGCVKNLVESGIQGASIDEIETAILTANSSGRCVLSPEQMSEASSLLFRLRRIHHDVRSVSIGTNIEVSTLGIAVPKSEFAPVAGGLIVLLYAWLLLSFWQLSGATARLSELFKGESVSAAAAKRAAHDILESSYFLRTSSDSTMRYFAYALYYSAPIVFTPPASFVGVLALDAKTMQDLDPPAVWRAADHLVAS